MVLRPLAAVESTVSHEVAEAVTDPEVSIPNPAWYDGQTGEVGDWCAMQSGAFVSFQGYTVQKIWSVSHQECTDGSDISLPVCGSVRPCKPCVASDCTGASQCVTDPNDPKFGTCATAPSCSTNAQCTVPTEPIRHGRRASRLHGRFPVHRRQHEVRHVDRRVRRVQRQRGLQFFGSSLRHVQPYVYGLQIQERLLERDVRHIQRPMCAVPGVSRLRLSAGLRSGHEHVRRVREQYRLQGPREPGVQHHYAHVRSDGWWVLVRLCGRRKPSRLGRRWRCLWRRGAERHRRQPRQRRYNDHDDHRVRRRAWRRGAASGVSAIGGLLFGLAAFIRRRLRR